MKAIVAYDKNYGIGYQGKLPWHIPEELHHFKTATQDHVCIMGRTTWENLPKKHLPNRELWVVTSRIVEGEYPKVKFFTKNELLKKISTPDLTFIVCGGILMYSFLADRINEWIITEIGGEYQCDTYFDLKLIKNCVKIDEIEKPFGKIQLWVSIKK